MGECGVGVADNGSLVTRGVYDLLRRWLLEKPFSGQWSAKQLGRLLVVGGSVKCHSLKVYRS